MKFEPAGKWEWQGVWLEDENSDPKSQSPITIWADNIEEAAKSALEDLPEGACLVYLARGRDMTNVSFDIPEDSPGAKALEEIRKKEIN